jgi:hypothetical protein
MGVTRNEAPSTPKQVRRVGRALIETAWLMQTNERHVSPWACPHQAKCGRIRLTPAMHGKGHCCSSMDWSKPESAQYYQRFLNRQMHRTAHGALFSCQMNRY